MSLEGRARQAWVFIEESDEWHGRPLWSVILERLRSLGCPGGTVFRGLAGFGSHRQVHTATLVELSANLPLVITFVDQPHRFADALSAIAELVSEGLVIVQDVQVVKCAQRATFPALKVADVMSGKVVWVRSDARLSEAFQILVGQRLRALPVVDEQQRLVGILTESDLLEGGSIQVPLRLHHELNVSEQAANLGPASPRLVSEVMTAKPVTIGPEVPLAQAAAVMVQHNVKRLPVVDSQGQLIGLLSRSDLLRTVAEEVREAGPEPTVAILPGATMGSLGPSPVPTADPEAPLPEVLTKLLETNRRRVVVVDSELHPVGIVTDGDLLRRMGRTVKPAFFRSLAARLMGGRVGDELELAEAGYLARDVMSSPVVSLTPEAPLEEGVRLMMTHRFKQLPVVDAEGRLLGLVGRVDLLRALQG